MTKVRKKSAVRHELEEIEARATKRYEYAMKIYQAQGIPGQAAINRIVSTMRRMAPRTDTEQETRIVLYNCTYMAVRLIVACAEWDIRISDFKALKRNCAKCGKEVKNGSV